MSSASVGAIGFGAGAGAGTVVGSGNGAFNEAPVLGSTALVVEVLKELDKDYMALRSRLVNLLEQQAHSSLQISSTTSGESQTVESSGSNIEKHGNEKEGVSDRDQIMGSLSVGEEADAVSHPIMNDDVTAHATASSTASTVNHLDRLEKSRTVYWPSRQLVRT